MLGAIIFIAFDENFEFAVFNLPINIICKYMGSKCAENAP